MAVVDEDDIARGCPGYEKNLIQNWNGNVRFGGTPIVPNSIEELRGIVRDPYTATPIRVVGRGHSFSRLAECRGGTLISMRRLNRIVGFEPPSTGDDDDDNKGRVVGSITVQGGTTYSEIARYLGTKGALRNLPSCPQFTVAGAIATGTHGSGIHFHNLSADVSMIEFVKGDGTLARYYRDDDNDNDIGKGCRIHLGCLGILSQLTIDVVPYYEVDSYRYDNVPLTKMIRYLPTLWNSCDSLSVWTSGFGGGKKNKQRRNDASYDDDDDWAGTCWITMRYFLRPGQPPVHDPLDSTILSSSEQEEEEPGVGTTTTGGGGILNRRTINRYCADTDDPHDFVPTSRAPWHDGLTLTMYQQEETKMTTVDLQAELFIPLFHAQSALQAVWDMMSSSHNNKDWTFSSPHGYTGGGTSTKGLVDAMEFRQIKGQDDIWLSPQNSSDRLLGIHISFNGDPVYRNDIVSKYIPQIEATLQPYGPVTAHWGKLAPVTFGRITKIYAPVQLQSFRDLCRDHDPEGKFRNDHTEQMLFTGTSSCGSAIKSRL